MLKSVDRVNDKARKRDVKRMSALLIALRHSIEAMNAYEDDLQDMDDELDRGSVLEEIQRFRPLLELCTDLLLGCAFPESLERLKEEMGYDWP